MSDILKRTRSNWAEFMFSNLDLDGAEVGPAFRAVLSELQQCRKRHDASVKGHCEAALRMAKNLHLNHNFELKGLGMKTSLVEGLVHLHTGIIHMERQEEIEAAKCFDDCLDVLAEQYPREKTVALLGRGLVEQWRGSLEDAVTTFQTAKASAAVIQKPSIRIQLNDEIDRLIEQGLNGLFTPQPGPTRTRPPVPPRSPRGFVNVSLLRIGSPIAGGIARPIGPPSLFDEYVEVTSVTIEGAEHRVFDLSGQGYVNLTSREQEHFVAQVVGDSMKDAGIEGGDYVVLRKPRHSPLQPHHQDIVAVAFQNTDRRVTLKRLKMERGGFALVPENPAFESEHFPSTGPQPEFVGVAIAVLKRGP